MTGNILFPLGLAAAAGAIGVYWRYAWLQERVRERLRDSQAVETIQRRERPFARRHRIVPWLAGATLAAMLAIVWSWPINICVGIGLVAALLLVQADAWFYEWRIGRIEAQLADVIDVLVSSVQAGASLQSALEMASNETRLPLRQELEEMVARLRLGDAPADVFELLRQRVPHETFRLFSTTLTVNWEVGGGLSETLAAVGQTIRDRMTIARQIRTLSTQGRITTVVVLGMTYFLGAMMWQSDSDRMAGFLSTPVGQWMVTIALVLQGVGVALVARISRPKV